MHEALATGCLPVSAAGLAGRALTAVASHPHCTPQQHSATLARWRELLSRCTPAAGPLAAALRWFAVFARVFPSDEYTHAVPAALLHGTSSAHESGGPRFLELMRAAQLSAGDSSQPAAAGGSRLLTVKSALAAGTSESPDVMGNASGGGKQARAVCMAAALQSDLAALSQSPAAAAAPGGNAATEVQTAAVVVAGALQGGIGEPGSAAQRVAALRDVLSTLQQLHAAEVRDGGALAGGILAACQTLQAAVQAGPRVVS